MKRKLAKQPNLVRGNKIACINYQMCPLCYGCRAFDNRDEDCITCQEEGKDGTKRNFNVCNTKLHEASKINQMISKNKIILDNNTEIKSWEDNKNE